LQDFTPDTGHRYAQPVRKVSHGGQTGRAGKRRRRISLLVRSGLMVLGLMAAVVAWAAVARTLAPMANSDRQTFDAIIVLGTPADSDGNPTPAMMGRVTEGVREYQRGIAPRLIVTGGAAHNGFVEAQVMARVAQAQGVPASVIFPEPQAMDTIQNACYSTRILVAHGLHSAEVVSSRSHLPRAAMIFGNLPLQWRMHAAPETLASGFYGGAAEAAETLKTARYLVWARWIENCRP